jgi:hypothetical protein
MCRYSLCNASYQTQELLWSCEQTDTHSQMETQASASRTSTLSKQQARHSLPAVTPDLAGSPRRRRG